MKETYGGISKGSYSVIVADPPWFLKKVVRKCRPNQTAALDYPTMSLEEIKFLPVQTLAAENSCLFLWTIQKYIEPSFEIMRQWGFKYQRLLTWDKGNGMSLFGFHHRTEFVLFGYRGKLEMYPRRPTFPTLISSRSGRHSAKPDEFYRLAEAFGESRIDLFARKKREGWAAWGNEVESDVVLVDNEFRRAA